MPEQPEPATSTSHSYVSDSLLATQSSLEVLVRPGGGWHDGLVSGPDCCERAWRCQSPGREGPGSVSCTAAPSSPSVKPSRISPCWISLPISPMTVRHRERLNAPL